MTWSEAEIKFAEKFAGYEVRLPQRQLAQTIEDALTGGYHLAAQAPCGTGKAYAGSIPVIDYARKTGLPVVVSTATKALQDQYAVKDLPALQEMYGDFRFTVVKGRSNYVCMAKLDEGPDLEGSINQLRQELAAPNATGDLDQLDTPITPFDRSKLSTSSDECPGKKDCPFGDVCFAEKAKTRAATSHVVVTNHSMLVTDAALKGGAADTGPRLLPEYSALLIDEAHELEEYATNTLSNEITERNLQRLVADVAAFLEDRKHVVSAVQPIAGLFGKLGTYVAEKERTVPLTPELLVELGDEVSAVLAMLGNLELAMAAYRVHADDQKSQQKKRLRRRLENATGRLESIILADFADLVRWVERESYTPKRGTGETVNYVALKFSPLSVAQFLRNNVWSKAPAVLMSATLAVGTDFSFVAERLGFGTDLKTFDCESPFDFTTQARTYVPSEIPNPKKNPGGYRAGVTANILELVKASDGRALLLFTSRTAMNDTYASVAPMIESMGHRVLRQGDAPTKQLANIFAEDEHSVLFALKSFFTGVDIQGDSLRLVIIDKLPFAVPTDVIFKARCDLIDAKIGGKWAAFHNSGSFNKLSIPTMALTLLQGYGRLIRSQSDRGLVAVLDPRLLTEGYGKKIMTSFPNAPVLKTLAEATSYLHSLEEQVVA